MTSWWAQQAAQMFPNHVKYTVAGAGAGLEAQQGQGQGQQRGSRRLKGKSRTQPHHPHQAGGGAAGGARQQGQWQGYGKGQIVVAPPSEHVCATEYWESMAGKCVGCVWFWFLVLGGSFQGIHFLGGGKPSSLTSHKTPPPKTPGPEALLPDDFLLAATAAQLKDKVDQDLSKLEDEQRDARVRMCEEAWYRTVAEPFTLPGLAFFAFGWSSHPSHPHPSIPPTTHPPHQPRTAAASRTCWGTWR
jgi:hypothetical protein